MPFGIPERGHKTRVPCLGSGFFNILQQPLRQALFSIIRDDPRCSYRAKGGEKRERLAKFLETMELSDLIHSGDLRVSTDNFSLDFNRAFVEGIYLTGKIDYTEYLILRAATGSFRILQDNDDTSLKRRMAQPAMLYTLPKAKIDDPLPLSIAQQKLCKRSGWDDFKHISPDLCDHFHQELISKKMKFKEEEEENLKLNKTLLENFRPGRGHQANRIDFICRKCQGGPPMECYILKKNRGRKGPSGYKVYKRRPRRTPETTPPPNAQAVTGWLCQGGRIKKRETRAIPPHKQGR
jgi:hypothetical protein